MGLAMSRLKLLNPFRIRAAVRAIRETSGGGGPASVRVTGITSPTGWLLPASEVLLEVTARDGSITRFAPAVPIPWAWAWAYRIARALDVPIVRALEPERLSFKLGIPGR